MTILLGAIGWGIVHVVEAIETPSIEYCVHSEDNGNIRIMIENLSRVHRFKNLKFGLAFRGEREGSFQEAGVEAIAPAFEGDQSGGQANGPSAEFEIPDLQPRAQWALTATFSDSASELPVFRLLQADGTVELLKCSWFTSIVKHELKFIIVFSILSLGVVLMLLSLAQPR